MSRARCANAIPTMPLPPVRPACPIGRAERGSRRRCMLSINSGRAACSPRARWSWSLPTGSSATPTTCWALRSIDCIARAGGSFGSIRSCASKDSKRGRAGSRPCCRMSTNFGRSTISNRWLGWWLRCSRAAAPPPTRSHGCRTSPERLYSRIYSDCGRDRWQWRNAMLSTDTDILKAAEDWRKQGRAVALATVVETWGSAPRPVGANLVIDQDGNFLGSVSGGCVEGAVVTEALDVIDSGKPKTLEFGVADETAWKVGLSCGGTIRVYVEKVV